MIRSPPSGSSRRGRYRPTGSSRPTRPLATSWSTAVATNTLVWLATRKVWTGRGGWPVRRLPTPETPRMVRPSVASSSRWRSPVRRAGRGRRQRPTAVGRPGRLAQATLVRRSTPWLAISSSHAAAIRTPGAARRLGDEPGVAAVPRVVAGPRRPPQPHPAVGRGRGPAAGLRVDAGGGAGRGRPDRPQPLGVGRSWTGSRRPAGPGSTAGPGGRPSPWPRRPTPTGSSWPCTGSSGPTPPRAT